MRIHSPEGGGLRAGRTAADEQSMLTTNLYVPLVTTVSKVRPFHGSNKGLNLSPLKNSPRLPYAWSFFAVSALTNA